MSTPSHKLTEGRPMRHMVVMSVTASIGIMAIYLVDLMDIFFVSLLGHEEVAAAAGYASTLLFFVSAMNIGLSVAAGTLVAMALGRDDRAIARDLTSASAMIAGLLGVIIPLMIYPALPFLIGALGAEGETARMAITYVKIVLPATALSGLSMVFVAVIRASGSASWAMYPAMLGALVNLVLDPLLIFGLNLGLNGAAIATVCARMATFALALHAVSRKFDLVTPPRLAVLGEHGRLIMGYALPAVLSSIAAPIGTAIITRTLSGFGNEAVAGMAIVGRLSPVVFSVINGLSGASGAIIGQNHGAGRIDRVHRAYLDAHVFLAVYVGIAVVNLFVFRTTIADIFNATGLAREIIYIFCGPFALIAFFNGSLFVSLASLSSLGRPRLTPALAWPKNTIGVIVFATIGASLFGLPGFAYGLLANAALFALVGYRVTLGAIVRPTAQETDTQAADLLGDAVETGGTHGKPLHH